MHTFGVSLLYKCLNTVNPTTKLQLLKLYQQFQILLLCINAFVMNLLIDQTTTTVRFTMSDCRLQLLLHELTVSETKNIADMYTIGHIHFGHQLCKVIRKGLPIFARSLVNVPFTYSLAFRLFCFFASLSVFTSIYLKLKLCNYSKKHFMECVGRSQYYETKDLW